MIANRWYPILDSRELTGSRPVGVTRLGERLVFWRAGNGKVVCMPDRCPHRSAALSPGKISDDCIECPYHGLRFDLSGRCVVIPANGANAPVPHGFDIATREVREAHGFVWYWHGDRQPAADVPWLDGMLEHGGNTYAFNWDAPVAPLRILENLFDFHHFHFLHRWSLPGMGPRVDDLSAAQDGDVITMSGKLCYEQPSALKRDTPFRIKFRLPCLAAIRLGGTDVTYAIVPVDAERTRVFGRYSHQFLPPALGGRFLSFLGSRLDRWVFVHQDFAVLKSQSDPVGDISRFKLYEADRGIGLFFGMVKRAMLEESGRGSNLTAAAGG